MARSTFATDYGRSDFVDSTTASAVWLDSVNEHSAIHRSEPVKLEPVLGPQDQPTKMVFVGVMLLDPARRSQNRRALALILLLKAALIACAVVLALNS